MNTQQKAAIQVIAEMIANQTMKLAIALVENDGFSDSKENMKAHFQSVAEDSSHEFFDSVQERIENSAFKIYNQKVREYLKK